MTVPWKDPVFEKWWPLGQVMTLVRAPYRRVAKAMKKEGKRLSDPNRKRYQYNWIRKNSLDEFFNSIEFFSIGCNTEYVLPTCKGWSVVLDNSSVLSQGYLGYRMAMNYQYDAIGFSSHDRKSITLAGTSFTYYKPSKEEEVSERNVYCCNQGKRWHFEQHGTPLPEEDLERYSLKRKRDRLNEAVFMDLLERIGIHPWRESTYDFRKKILCITDTLRDPSAEIFTFRQLQERALGVEPAPVEEEELPGPPEYLKEYCSQPHYDGPARLLRDGKWCGHGESKYWIYDITLRKETEFTLQISDPNGIPAVRVTPKHLKESFVIYDSRCHPASVYSESDQEPEYNSKFSCEKCRSEQFLLSVGFEVPADADSSNDTSWFALAAQCTNCGDTQIIYQDETA